MPITGSKTGALQILGNCGGAVSGNVLLNFSGASANPCFGVVAPVALAGAITGGTVTTASATFAGTEKIGVFWTIAGVAYQRLDCTIASGTGTTHALTNGSGDALPDGGQAVLIAVRQDVTDGVSINGSNLMQLMAVSTQPGAVVWETVTPAIEHTSTILAANGMDAWPTSSGQVAPPTGWTAAAVVVTIGFYNNSLVAATMQAAVLLA
jgi:hypothetical protein